MEALDPYRATMSATWLPTMPPNQRHWSRMWSMSSPTYAGAATQKVMASGSRPASEAAMRTASIVHAAMSGSASWRMNPSPTSPVSASAFGPYAATQTSSSLASAHGKHRLAPWCSTVRPLPSSRITWMDSRSVASVVGLPLRTRTAESPRPIPHTVRFPYMSLRVANRLAVTVQSRVAGLVTIGPTITLRVSARIWL